MFHFTLITWIKAVGYPGISAIIFLESGVPFGFFLPGASLLFTAGLLSSKGFFNPWLLIVMVTLAAILGDNAGYWFGRKVGVRFFLKPNSKWFKHEHLERTKIFYDSYGTRAVFFGRFIPVVRTFAPIVAGVVAMPYRTFLAFNVLGALCWAAGTTFIGYYLGAKVPFVSHYITPIVLILILATTLPLLHDVWKKGPKNDMSGDV